MISFVNRKKFENNFSVKKPERNVLILFGGVLQRPIYEGSVETKHRSSNISFLPSFLRTYLQVSDAFMSVRRPTAVAQPMIWRRRNVNKCFLSVVRIGDFASSCFHLQYHQPFFCDSRLPTLLFHQLCMGRRGYFRPTWLFIHCSTNHFKESN